MIGESKQASSASVALILMIIGSLTSIWSALKYFFFTPAVDAPPDAAKEHVFWCLGFFLTGLALFVIGLFVGRIGRSARQAEVLPAAAQVVTTPPAGGAVIAGGGTPGATNAPGGMIQAGSPEQLGSN